jgi:hypothetical protein
MSPSLKTLRIVLAESEKKPKKPKKNPKKKKRRSMLPSRKCMFEEKRNNPCTAQMREIYVVGDQDVAIHLQWLLLTGIAEQWNGRSLSRDLVVMP